LLLVLGSCFKSWPTGQVSVPAGTSFGTYTITYRSRKIKSQHCDTAVVTIPVTAATIDAVNDTVALLMELMEILLLECTYISNGNGPIL
jgi:hypothetical protein